jgi:hypothetical protein
MDPVEYFKLRSIFCARNPTLQPGFAIHPTSCLYNGLGCLMLNSGPSVVVISMGEFGAVSMRMIDLHFKQ